MEEKKMIKVIVDGAEYAYPQGVPYRVIAENTYLCACLLRRSCNKSPIKQYVQWMRTIPPIVIGLFGIFLRLLFTICSVCHN
mgnify:CR=1 FL=1